MSITPDFSGGYYDDDGNWHRARYCFVYCGHSCTCEPPISLYYSPRHDKRLKGQEECKNTLCSCRRGFCVLRKPDCRPPGYGE